VRRSPLVRFVALLVQLVVGLSAPAAALAHGEAHHREAHERSHRQAAGQHGWGEDATAADHHAASRTTAWAPTATVAGADHAGEHAHPSVDVGLKARADFAATVLAAPAELRPLLVVERDVSPVPMFAARLRASPPTGPPPKLRAPPLA